MEQNYTWIFLIVIMAVMLWVMSRSTKKARRQAEEQRNAAVQVGKTVVTHSGFFGTIVDIDGDAVTLASPAGDETVWLKSAIRSEAEIPLGDAPEEDADEATPDDASETPTSEAGTDTTAGSDTTTGTNDTDSSHK